MRFDPKHLLPRALGLSAAVSLSAVLSLSATPALAEQTLRFGHDNKADMTENPAHAFTGVFANILKADTNGEVVVEVFPSNQLGSAKEHIQMVRDGVLQGTLSSVGALAGYYPRISVLDVPFAYDSNAATYQVFDGPFGQALAADIEAELGDVKVLGFPDTGGFFSITNSKRPITKLEDFEGIRIRTMTLPTHERIIQSLGGQAYPLAWGEVYSSLQTGVIDGQMNPIPTVSFAKFDEVQDYLTLTNHLFTPYALLVNKAFYDGLSDEQRKVLHYAAASGVTASRGISRVIEASADRGLEGLTGRMNVNALSAEERQRFREAAQPAVKDYVAESLGEKGKEMMELFLSEVEKANAGTYLPH